MRNIKTMHRTERNEANTEDICQDCGLTGNNLSGDCPNATAEGIGKKLRKLVS